MCEGDDYWTDPYKLQKQVDYMEDHEDCGLCFHAFKIESNENIINEVRVYNDDCISPTEDIILGDGGFISTNSILYRKSIMQNPPNFYLECSVGDYPLQIYTSTQQYAYYINECMSVYRYFSNSSWTRRIEESPDAKEKIIIHRKSIIKLLNDINLYTNNKYEYAISEKTLLLEMDVLLLKNQLRALKTLKNSKYDLYKSVYKKLGRREKIKYGFPILYSIVRKYKEFKYNN